MIILLEFILGMLMVKVGFPLLEGICGLALTALEAAKGYFSKKIARYNAEISQQNVDKSGPIGFRYEEEK